MTKPKKAGYLHGPEPAPDLDIPSGRSIRVSIIDCTARITAPVAHFMTPAIEGHESLVAPCFSFLIEHTSGRKLLFDLGVRKDPENLAPSIQKVIQSPGWNIDVEKNVAEILQENGVDAAGGAIEAIIWSHAHFDHTGDPSTFPGSTDLVIGPGMVETLLPPYPQNPESPLLESSFAGREVRTIDFLASPLKVGPFPAFDYFGDGSFYLLDAPGHAVGHMCGLARTTSKQDGHEEDTFVFMGGDTAHHGGEFRPTSYLPLPVEIDPTPLPKVYPGVCPGHIFQELHAEHSANKPFYKIDDKLPFNVSEARRTCNYMQEFDVADNVFVVIAHDCGLLGPSVDLPWFPQSTVNDWKKKDLATKGRWQFLKDFGHALAPNSVSSNL